MHFACGVLGSIAIGFFATEHNVQNAYQSVLRMDNGGKWGGGTVGVALWTAEAIVEGFK